MIEGVAWKQFNRDRFQLGATIPPLPLFSLWPRRQAGDTGEIKLSLSAALVLAEQEHRAYNPGNTDLLDQHRTDLAVPGFPDLREERFRLDKHIVLGNLFATTRPLSEGRVICRWFANHQGVVRRTGSMQLRNMYGLTVYDILHRACQVGGLNSTEDVTMRNCIGMQLGPDNRQIYVRTHVSLVHCWIDG
jgi:hypothetical protein